MESAANHLRNEPKSNYVSDLLSFFSLQLKYSLYSSGISERRNIWLMEWQINTFMSRL